jgi:methyl-accepting chemotaxis protein
MSTAMNSGAAATEQTTANLQMIVSAAEEMSATINEIAANTSKGSQTTAEAVAKAEHISKKVDALGKAALEISKVTDTISDISEQTNLLALNATIEAARAGEAGAGFAVVADEVRNLAMRAAEAARNTAELIERTVIKVGDGSDLVSATNDAFAKVAESTARVGELVAEISQASNEQSNGIGQVNIAISEMDKIVQLNAANAEESASASEEMNAQAEQLREYVGDLAALVTGKKDQGAVGHHTNIAPAASQTKFRKSGKAKRLVENDKEVRPEQVIPFDGDEFKDF